MTVKVMLFIRESIRISDHLVRKKKNLIYNKNDPGIDPESSTY